VTGGALASTVPLTATRADALALPLRLLSDARLSRLAAKGSTAAFAAIYERHHQPLYRYCRSILLSGEDAADALQNAMASAFEALRGEDRELNLRPWLYRIAHNEAISILRRRQPATDPETLERMAGPDLEAIVEGNGRLRELVADLGELPEQQRGALLMRELSGLGYDEIAESAGITEGAARQSVYEARLALHEFKEGRDLECESVRRTISENDGRRMRSRKVRAHLRDCRSCTEFDAAMAPRRRQLAALAPPIPAGAATGLLGAILGAVGGGGGGAAGTAAVGGGVAAKVIGSSPAMKGAAAALSALAVGGGAVVTQEVQHIAPHSQARAGAARAAHQGGPATSHPGSGPRRSSIDGSTRSAPARSRSERPEGQRGSDPRSRPMGERPPRDGHRSFGGPGPRPAGGPGPRPGSQFSPDGRAPGTQPPPSGSGPGPSPQPSSSQPSPYQSGDTRQMAPDNWGGSPLQPSHQQGQTRTAGAPNQGPAGYTAGPRP
jgi:RNA polymerase sigma factor (sigma-70 family)